MSLAPLRRLPIPVAPVHRETIDSFIHRLAAVNHLDAEDLADTLATARWKSVGVLKRTFSASRLASVTGRSPQVLTRALPELADPTRRFPAHRVLHACPRCTRRHRGGPVKIHPQPYQHVCVRHDLWLGSLCPHASAWIKRPGPIDVSALPVIRAAQRRHHSLVRHRGLAATTSAVRTAVDTWEHGQHLLGRRQWKRLHVLRPGATTVSVNDQAASAVCYPEIITIAGVLASPHWQAVATHYNADHAAIREILRRLRHGDADLGLGDYSHIWPSRGHPLRDWADDIRRARPR